MSVKSASVVFRSFIVVSKIKKRHTANKILNQAVLNKAF